MAKAKTDEPIEGEITDQKPKRVKAKTSAVAKVETGIVAGLALSTDQLKVALETQTEQRALIANFVKKHLVKGTDYLRIHVVKNCQAEDKRRGSCRTAGHFSKDILAKPGQEKIFSLFQLTSELQRDDETIEMLAGTRGLVAFKCLVKRGDVTVAEGRGACVVGERGRDTNSTIKIAEKRARMDACLSLGFSEYFAQDLDDPDYQNQKKAAEEQAAAQADDGTGLPPRPKNVRLDDQERSVLARYLLLRGFDSADEQLELLRINGIEQPKEMTSGQARDMILKLKNQTFAAPASTGTVLDDDEDEPSEPAAPPPPPPPAEEELIVDDDLKQHIRDNYATIGLNSRGKMWFFKAVSGKPFADFDKLEEDDWRKAYEFIMAILDSRIEVDEHHIAGLVSAPGEQAELVKPAKTEEAAEIKN